MLSRFAREAGVVVISLSFVCAAACSATPGSTALNRVITYGGFQIRVPNSFVVIPHNGCLAQAGEVAVGTYHPHTTVPCRYPKDGYSWDGTYTGPPPSTHVSFGPKTFIEKLPGAFGPESPISENGIAMKVHKTSLSRCSRSPTGCGMVYLYAEIASQNIALLFLATGSYSLAYRILGTLKPVKD